MSKDREFSACCGLYCGDCVPFNWQLFRAAEELRDELERVDFHKYARLKGRSNDVFNKFDVFQQVLSEMIKLRCEKTCVNGGGRANCEIRACVHTKELAGCWECCEFESCELLVPLAVAHGDTNTFNLRLIKEFGIDNWADRRGKHYIWEE